MIESADTRTVRERDMATRVSKETSRRGSGRKPRPAPPIDESRADQILREAAFLFRSRGYEQTTLQNIAEAANMTRPALYWHFSSKEQILYEHLRALVPPWYGSAQDAMQNAGSPDAQIRAFVRTFINFQLENPLFRLGWGNLARTGQFIPRLPQEQQKEFEEISREMVLALEGVLRRGVETGVFHQLDVRLTANAIINMCYVFGAWVVPSGPVELSKVPDTYAGLISRMVAADVATAGPSLNGR
jgi:AcrR family transcriptional regulator